ALLQTEERTEPPVSKQQEEDHRDSEEERIRVVARHRGAVSRCGLVNATYIGWDRAEGFAGDDPQEKKRQQGENRGHRKVSPLEQHTESHGYDEQPSAHHQIGALDE